MRRCAPGLIDRRYDVEIAALTTTRRHDHFHWQRFLGRWKAGLPIGIPKTMFLNVVGRKLGLFPTSPTLHRKWRTWLRTWEFSDALVWVVVCDNAGDPLPHP